MTVLRDYFEEVIESRGLKYEDVLNALKFSEQYLNWILDGEIKMTKAESKKFQKVFKTPVAHIWDKLNRM